MPLMLTRPKSQKSKRLASKVYKNYIVYIKTYNMILPKLNIHLTQKHIPKELAKLTNDKIVLFRKEKLLTANPSEQVGVLTGYETQETDLNCGGFCNYNSRVIAFNGFDLKTLFHEVAHALQAECGQFSKPNTKLLSHSLNLEWQAETIAYKMYSSLIDKNISHTEFNAYFSIDHVQFLKEWYGSWVQFDEPDIKLKTL